MGEVTITKDTTSAVVTDVATRTDENYDQGSATTTASVTSATGGNYENLVHTDTATANVVDDNDA